MGSACSCQSGLEVAGSSVRLKAFRPSSLHCDEGLFVLMLTLHLPIISDKMSIAFDAELENGNHTTTVAAADNHRRKKSLHAASRRWRISS